MATSNVHESPSKEYDEPITVVEKGWKTMHLTQYQGLWIRPQNVPAVMAFRDHFESHSDDIILTTLPKSGTTWLKALTFTLINRNLHDFDSHPLPKTNPHDLVPSLDFELYANGHIPDLTNLPSPRLFASHLPYNLLPTSMIKSIAESFICVEIQRTPLFPSGSSITSFYQRMNPFQYKRHLNCSIKGSLPGAPFGSMYWGNGRPAWRDLKESCLLNNEELKEDLTFHLRRLAEFLGFPFSVEEERQGMIEKIQRLCSFESLTSLDVNKSGNTRIGIKTDNFFGHGVVGDWVNHLTAEMIERLDQLALQKFGCFDLVFKE